MCSTCDCDDLTKKIESGLEIKDKNRLCRKCGSQPFVILDKVHVECRSCFLESCNKKLRSTIGKSKLIRNNDPILVACSGGPSSAALLDLIRCSNTSDLRREQKFRPSILHVDVQSAIQSDLTSCFEGRRAKLFDLLEHLRQSYPDWPLYWTSLEMVMADSAVASGSFSSYRSIEDIDNNCRLLSNHDAHTSLTKALSSSDLTDKHQKALELCSTLVNQVAAQINESMRDSNDRFKYLFTASSATQLANNLLVDVILGRGSTIRSTVSICDRRPTVPVLRPMRDFSKKEIAFYLQARGIESRIQENLVTNADRKSCIQTLSEAFLSKLHTEYPSTYSTLLRTGNKMQN